MGLLKKRIIAREPQFIPSPLNNEMLNYSVYYLSRKQKFAYNVLLLMAGGLAGLVFYGGLFKEYGDRTVTTYISDIVVFLTVGLLAIKLFMPSVIEILKNKRSRLLKKQFMSLLDALSTSLSAGQTVNDAFIASKDSLLNQYTLNDLIVVEIQEINDGVKNGVTLETMVKAFADRSDNVDIQTFANVISNCYRLGGNFKDVVRKTRDVISDKIAISEEINTKIASNKLQLNAMCIMPLVLVAMLKLSSSSFADNLATPSGVVVTTVSVCLFYFAYNWGKKIIDIR